MKDTTGLECRCDHDLKGSQVEDELMIRGIVFVCFVSFFQMSYDTVVRAKGFGFDT